MAAVLVVVTGVLALERWGSRQASDSEPLSVLDAGTRETAPTPGGPGTGALQKPAPSSPPAAADPKAIDRPAPPTVDRDALVDFQPPDALVRSPRPSAVRGIYLNAWSAGSQRRLAQLMELADRTEINAFVIDVKDVTGHISYPSRVPLARQVGADRQVRIGDIRGVLSKLRARGIYTIARIVAFKDPLLATQRSQLAIRDVDGSLWRDQNGEIWVDPYRRMVWDYNIALAREAAALGFNEIQWDYVRFPDAPHSYLATQAFPARQGRSRAEVIHQFLEYSRARLAPYDVLVTADVFGLTTSANNDLGIGQLWSLLNRVTDVLLPMVYPSHYVRGSYGIDHPNSQPYETVKTAMQHAIRRNEGTPSAAAIRPWLQDFSLGKPAYGPAHVRAQIKAVYDAGLDSWVLWNPSSRYTVAALAPEGGPDPWFPLPYTAPAQRRVVLDSMPQPKIELLGVPAAASPPDTLRR